MIINFDVASGRMNREVLYLVGIFFVGCVAIIFRSISFNLAGERFVARLRKKVTISEKNSVCIIIMPCIPISSLLR